MDLYTVFKFLHVLAAMAWFGAGAMLLMQSTVAAMRNDQAGLMESAGRMGALGMVWFMPAAMLTLLSGLVATTLGGLWGEAWVLLGLLGLLASVLTGHFVLRTRGMAAGQMMAEGRTEEGARIGRRIIAIAQFDYCVIAGIIFLMVFKPGWGDLIELGILAAALVLAAVATLGLPERRSVEQAA
jgi:uncharacterized membrane protein